MADHRSNHPRGDLAGKVSLITGAASGIGLAIARRFVQEGSNVALWDFNPLNLQSACQELSQLSGEEALLTMR